MGRQQILDFLKEYGDLSVKELTTMTGLSRQRIHTLLKEMQNNGAIQKLGSSPHVYYQLQSVKQKNKESKLDDKATKILEDRFTIFTAEGMELSGYQAMSAWSNQRNLEPDKTALEYIKTLQKYDRHVDENGFISGIQKLNETKGLEDIFLTNVFYLDFYAIERFGKTRYGQWMHYGKSGQNRRLVQKLTLEIKPKIKELCSKLSIEAVGYIPPTIKRETQFMKLLESGLNLDLPVIDILKIKGETIIPQKALSKIGDRVLNARRTFVARDQRKFKKILLIDDAIGSGATMNEVAAKVHKRGISKSIFGLAITGSYKGFEVIKEV